MALYIQGVLTHGINSVSYSIDYYGTLNPGRIIIKNHSIYKFLINEDGMS